MGRRKRVTTKKSSSKKTSRKKARKCRTAKYIDGKQVLDSYQLKNIVNLAAGNFVVVRAPAKTEYFAKVEAVVRDKAGKVHVVVTWLYQPESTLDGYGRLPYHGVHELFLSNHEDCLDIETIERKCEVLTLLKYQKSKKVGPEHDTYFARYFYDVELENVYPISTHRLHIQCICKLPCNPDKLMISCDRCSEWFHPECLGLSIADLKKGYLCPNCKCFLINTPVSSTSHRL